MLERFLEPRVADPSCCCPHCGRDSLYLERNGWVCYKCDERIEVSEPDYGDDDDNR